MERVRLCVACGKALILDKEHHKVVRDDTETGLYTIGRKNEPIHYDAFDCEYCGCQTIIGERKREVYEVKFEDTEEDIKVESEPQDEQISSPEDDCPGTDNCWCDCQECDINKKKIEEDDANDIRKKIAEAGE